MYCRTLKQVAYILFLTHENDYDLDRKGNVPYHNAKLATQQIFGSYQQRRSLPYPLHLSPYSGHQLLGVQFVTNVEISLCTSATRRRHNCTSTPRTSAGHKHLTEWLVLRLQCRYPNRSAASTSAVNGLIWKADLRHQGFRTAREQKPYEINRQWAAHCCTDFDSKVLQYHDWGADILLLNITKSRDTKRQIATP